MSVAVKLLGEPAFTVGEERSEPPPGKTSALLYYLAYKAQWVGRDELVYLLWPDSTEGAARKNLRQLLTTVRRLPYIQELETEDTRLRWRVPTDVQLLRQAFEEKDWVRAAELYGGELLQGYQLPELPEFEEWLEQERRELAAAWRVAVLALAGELETTGRYVQAAEQLGRLRKADPLDEEVLRRSLRALRLSGQRDRALKTFEAFAEDLAKELGGEPEDDTLHLIEAIQADAAPDGTVTPPAPKHNLPSQPTPFIGREAEKGRIEALLSDPSCRLLTLIGPGGIGKTRLAIEVASEQLEHFKEGVWFVPLAPVSSPEFVATTIADSLNFSFYGAAEPKAQLLEYLRTKELLLILDNFEQLVAAAPLVSELLSSCPQLKVLVTSREVLRIYGEREYPVPPLTLPDPKRLPSLEQLSQYEAVQVFIQRAVAVKPDFKVSNENAPAVAEICHRLDGLPLAIELAAARVKLFSPQSLLARLSSRLQMLTGGPRDLPARQQTLRNTIDWSYKLLEPTERILFARLSVFAGGRSLEAIEAVCIEHGGLELDSLTGVASLVDKSLLRQEESSIDEPRFVMLETIHEYAQERLEESGEAESVRTAHAEFFLGFAEEADRRLKGPEQATWLERLEAEHDNFRTALRWAIRGNKVGLGLQLAGALWRFWDMRGHFSEGRGWLEGALSESRHIMTSARAGALHGAGVLALVQGDYPSARALFEESLAIYRELRDELGAAAPLSNLGHVAFDQGDYPLARARYEESSLIYRQLGDRWGTASSLVNLGIVAGSQGDYPSARTCFEESLAAYRELGEKLGVANSLTNLGTVAFAQGDYTAAHALHQEALTIYQELRDKAHIALTLASLGDVVGRQGDYTSARHLYKESLVIRRELGAKANIANLLEELARLATHKDLERSARLWGAAEAIREAIGAPLPLVDRARYDADVGAACSRLGEGAFTLAWAQGRATPLEEAIAYALDDDS